MVETLTASFEIEQQGDWLHICPAGPTVTARDGRNFNISNAHAAVARSELPLLLDWEHDSEKWDRASPAAGWGEALEVRTSGVWMRTKYTTKGAEDVASLRYRYLSPVVVFDTETREVESFVSVALTNKPALRMSQIGDLAAFRSQQKERIACSMRETGTSKAMGMGMGPFELAEIDAETRAEAKRRGMTDEQIDAVQAFHRERRDRYKKPVDEDAVRREFMRRGGTREQYDAVIAHDRARRERFAR